MKLLSQGSLARLLLSSLLACLCAAAQVQPPSAYKLIEVKVTGSKRFTQKDIVAASGLPVGTVCHEEDFKKAARQLGETGAFGVINYTYTYSSAGTKLEFHVTDADKFVPAHFTDLSGSPTKNYIRSCTTGSLSSTENCPPTGACLTRSRTFSKPCWSKTEFPESSDMRAPKARTRDSSRLTTTSPA